MARADGDEVSRQPQSKRAKEDYTYQPSLRGEMEVFGSCDTRRCWLTCWKEGFRFQLKATFKPNTLMYSRAGRQSITRTDFRNSLYRHRTFGSTTVGNDAVWLESIKWGDHAVGRHGGGGCSGGERSGHDGRKSRVDRDVRTIGSHPQLRMRCP